MRNLLIAAGLLALLILTAAAGISAWIGLGDVKISGAGWLAMAGGVLLSLLVGGGLMALVFFSSRSGHDEAAQRHSEEDPPEE